MSELSALFGVFVGFSLGLTGGGGSIFAVPLLVYGLSASPRDAVGISLGAVGVTALVGFLGRLPGREVELRTGILFAVSGMLGAPLGSSLGGHIPDTALLSLFSVLMLLVAAHMWVKATRNPEESTEVRALLGTRDDVSGSACRRDPSGKLEITSRCAVVLSLAGIVTGVLSGLFGVGGGFVIVPALVFFSGMDIRRAVATSLLVVALVSLSGALSYAVSGETLNIALALLFAAGGIAGLLLGMLVAKRLSGPVLQKVFAVAIVLVAGFTIAKTIVS